MNIVAKRFLECWFYDVWALSSVINMDRYYSKSATGTFNGEALTRKDVEAHCAWCKDNEKITHFEFSDVIAEQNKIAFRIQYSYVDKATVEHHGENMVIFHLDEEGKIARIWVKSSEQFSR